MEYKLLAIDMDGTLLNSKKEISNRTVKAITAAKNKGVNVILATGRILRSAELYAKELNLNNYILASNGAIITNNYNKVVYSKPLDKFNVNRIIEIGNKYSVYNHFYDEEILYSNTYSKEVIEYYRNRDQEFKIEIFEDATKLFLNKDLNVYKFLFIDNDPNKLSRLSEELSTLKNISLTKSWSNNIEIMDTEVSKGKGIEFLCNMLNIPRANVIAIGDNENDLSMINYAGLGVAMGNAEDIVKNEADYITLTNDEDGVAAVIEKFIL